MKRRWIVAAALLLLLAGLAGLYAAATSRERIERELAAWLGARVEVGSVDRLWWGLPGVAVSQLRATREDFALRAESVQVRLRLLPFLVGHPELRRVRIREAELVVAPEFWKQLAWPALWELGISAAWEFERVHLKQPGGERAEELFYLDRLAFAPASASAYAIQLVGGPSREAAAAVRLEGQASFEAALQPWRGRGALRLALHNFSPERLWRALGRTAPAPVLNGEVSIGATGRRSARASGTLEARDAATNEFLRTEFTTVLDPDELQFDRIRVAVGGVKLAGSGRVSSWLSRQPAFDLSVEVPRSRWDTGALLRLAQLWPRAFPAELTEMRGEFSANLRVAGRWPHPLLDGQVELDGVRWQRPPWPALEKLSGRLEFKQGVAELKGVRGEFLGAAAQLGGSASAGELRLRLETAEFPVSALPVPPEVTNLGGGMWLTLGVTGTLEDPLIAGAATLSGGSLDYGEPEIAVRDVNASLRFDNQRAQVEEFTGWLGPCQVAGRGQTELAGPNWPRLNRARWRQAATVEVESDGCDISFLRELATGFAPQEVAPVFSRYLSGLTGRADWQARYADGQWEGALELREAEWELPELAPIPSGQAQPLAEVTGRVEWQREPDSGERVRLAGLRARWGQSEVELRGSVHLARAAPVWELEAGLRLQPADAALLLGPLGKHLQLPEPVTARLRVTGSSQEGFAWEAHLEPHSTSDAPAADNGEARMEGQGRWHSPRLSLDSMLWQMDDSRVELRGHLTLASEPEVDLHLQAASATPLAALLRYVRLPEGLESIEGSVEADLHLDGKLGALQPAGHVTVRDLRLPEFLGEPVRIDGSLHPDPQGVRLEGVRIEQPRGTFGVAGHISWRGESALSVSGDWLNLDSLTRGAGRHRSAGWLRQLARRPVHVELVVAKGQFLGLQFADVNAAIRQREGVLTLAANHFGIGVGTGSASLEADWNQQRVTTHLSLDQVPLESLLALFQLETIVRAPLALEVDLRGPLGTRAEFLRAAEGTIKFQMLHGRIRKGTLPERLFTLARFLHHGVYGFSLSFNWLFRALKPPNLRRFHSWTGEARFGGGKTEIDSTIAAQRYTLRFTGPIDLASSEIELHGEGEYRSGFEFNLSLRSLVNAFRRLFRLGGRKHSHEFEFDLSGTLEGRKSVNNFHFKD